MIIEIKQPPKLLGNNIVLGGDIQIVGRTEEGASSLFDRLSQFDFTKSIDSPKFIRIWGSRTENFTYHIKVDNYLPFLASDIKGVKVPRNCVIPMWYIKQPLASLLMCNVSIDGTAVALQSVKSNEELIVATHITFSYVKDGFKYAVLGDEITIPKSRIGNSDIFISDN